MTSNKLTYFFTAAYGPVLAQSTFLNLSTAPKLLLRIAEPSYYDFVTGGVLYVSWMLKLQSRQSVYNEHHS